MKTLFETNIEIHLYKQMANCNIRTIKELHERTGISRTTLSELLNGKKKTIHLGTIYRLCSFFDCSVGELIEIKDDVGA